MFADDAPMFLADFGEGVSWTDSVSGIARNGKMLFDQPDAEIQQGAGISRDYLVTFETAAWPSLRREERLVIAGAGRGLTYKLRTDPQQADDAVFSHARLTRVTA